MEKARLAPGSLRMRKVRAIRGWIFSEAARPIIIREHGVEVGARREARGCIRCCARRGSERAGMSVRAAKLGSPWPGRRRTTIVKQGLNREPGIAKFALMRTF